MKDVNSFKKNQLTNQETSLIFGGAWERVVVTQQPNAGGVPNGVYWVNTETGAWYDVLGQQVY